MVKETFDLRPEICNHVLNSGEVYEHVFRTVIRSNKAEAFISVEPFYDTSHFTDIVYYLKISAPFGVMAQFTDFLSVKEMRTTRGYLMDNLLKGLALLNCF